MKLSEKTKETIKEFLIEREIDCMRDHSYRDMRHLVLYGRPALDEFTDLQLLDDYIRSTGEDICSCQDVVDPVLKALRGLLACKTVECERKHIQVYIDERVIELRNRPKVVPAPCNECINAQRLIEQAKRELGL